MSWLTYWNGKLTAENSTYSEKWDVIYPCACCSMACCVREYWLGVYVFDLSAFSEEGTVGDRELGRISRENSLRVSAWIILYVTHRLWVVYMRFWSLLFVWASCLINYGHFVRPLEYVISLIRWSLRCIRLQNYIYLTRTTLHCSKTTTPIRLKLCSFILTFLFWTTLVATKTCSLGSKYIKMRLRLRPGLGLQRIFGVFRAKGTCLVVVNVVLPRWYR